MALLKIKNLSVTFQEPNNIVTAVNNISYSIQQGEILGIVGESGSGKSVSSLAIMDLINSSGKVKAEQLEFSEQDLLSLNPKERRRLNGSEIAMIFQDPTTSLNPCFSVGFQIMETLKIHQGGTKKELRQASLELLSMVGIHEPKININAYPHQLSGGMCQRVMIAMAIACKPKLLIADEPTTGLDVTIQKQIVDLLIELQKKEGMGLIFISHDLALVSSIADRIIVMHNGEIVEEGAADNIFQHPKHEYTKALLRSLPQFYPEKTRLEFIQAKDKPQARYSKLTDLQLDNIVTTNPNEPLLVAKQLSKYYSVGQGLFKPKKQIKAVDGISFSLEPGKTVAIVGESGSGKSTLGRLLTMIESPTAGELYYKGHNLIQKDAKLQQAIRHKIQIVFQNPYASLNPNKKIGTILEEPLIINTKLSAQERKQYVLNMMDQVGLSAESYARYPHMFSGGERQRIAIARGLMLQPDIIIADEPVSSLDVSIRAQVLNLMLDLQQEMGLSYVFISHDLSVVRHIADEVIVMYLGKCVERGTSKDIFANPQHPYTKNLIASIPLLQLEKNVSNF